MTNAAAVQAQLVDIRNIGHDKCVKLTLHVPAEQAQLVLDAFGWPTAVEPVPVALARLQQPKESAAQPRPSVTPATLTGGAHSKSWHELSGGQQAGILCREPTFIKFLSDEVAGVVHGLRVANSEQATTFVREFCGVLSRSEIDKQATAKERWRRLVSDYRAWMREPEVVL